MAARLHRARAGGIGVAGLRESRAADGEGRSSEGNGGGAEEAAAVGW
jgi:hypothetical protein